MSVNSEVKALLDSYGYPVTYLNSNTSKDKYFVFNFDDQRGLLYGDDIPNIDVYSLQVHFFSPITFDNVDLKEKLKKDLLDNGWTYPIVTEIYEDDTDKVHLIFSCEKEVINTWQKSD